MSSTTRHMCLTTAFVLVLASNACQLVAPLPELEGEGGGGGGAELSSSASSASSASSVSSTSTTTPPVTCVDAPCTDYCNDLTVACAATPQFPSVEACCTVCATYDSDANAPGSLSCRVVDGAMTPGDCTAAGPLGATSASVDDEEEGCEAASQCSSFCELRAALCGDSGPLGGTACWEKCVDEGWDATPSFSACQPLTEDKSLGCRVQQLLRAMGPAPMETLDKACERAEKGECAPEPCL